MIVHFVSSSLSLEEDWPFLRCIVDTIHAGGHEVARDWIELAYKREIEKAPIETDWAKIAKANLEAITRADVVVMEATSYSFSQGFQTATALQQKKPTLLVYREDSPLPRHFGGGVSSDFLHVHSYASKKELEELVAEFLEDNVLTTKDTRFNFFIDREIYNYLRWSSSKTGKTKSEILRTLLEKEIERQEKSL